MVTTKWIFIALYIFAWIPISKSACYTSWGIKGHCVNIKKCDQLYSLLKQRPLTSAVLNVLRKAQCGFEGFDPKVCCVIQNKKFDDKIESKSNFETLIFDKPITITTRTTTTTTTTTTLAPPPVLMPVDDHPNRRLLDEDICGPITEGRIYGGNDTLIYEFPWMGLLGYDVGTESLQFRCGASLVNKRYVLTAAHCTTLLPDKMKLMIVRIGDYDLSTERDCDDIPNGVGFNCAAPYQEFAIDRIHVHPEYTKKKLHNDIALIRLNGEADMSPLNVRPICLPLGKSAVLKAYRVIVTGWGSTEFGMKSEKLLKVTLPIVTIKKCRDVYRNRFKIWHKQICAGGTNQMDSCSGDSGGPLQAMVFYDGKPRMVQYGIVSFGPQSCGVDGFPGVYTSVAYYVNWILDQIME